MEISVLILKRLMATALFFYIIFKFRRAARATGGTPWKWSSLGVLVFYSSFFIVAVVVVGAVVGGASLTGSGLSDTEREAMRWVAPVAMLAGLLSAFAAANLTLRRLIARARGGLASSDSHSVSDNQ